MTTAAYSLFLLALAATPLASGQGLSSTQPLGDAKVIKQASCEGTDSSEVVICGKSQQRFRIDPSVLAATRAAEAAPPKPPVTGEVPEAGCVGPDCGGATIPLVGMALTALKAAELAAEGEDWRDAFRTHPDEYQAYQAAKSRTGRISVGLGAGNR